MSAGNQLDNVGEDVPVAQGHPAACSRPDSVDPSTVSAYYDQNEPLLLFVIFDPGVKSRDTLEWAQVDIDLGVVRRRGGGGGNAASADGNIQGLEIIGEVGEDEAVVCADLLGGGVVEVVEGLVGDGEGGVEGILGVCDSSSHCGFA